MRECSASESEKCSCKKLKKKMILKVCLCCASILLAHNAKQPLLSNLAN